MLNTPIPKQFQAYNLENIMTEIDLFINLDKSLKRQLVSVSLSVTNDYMLAGKENPIMIYTAIILYRIRKWYHIN